MTHVYAYGEEINNHKKTVTYVTWQRALADLLVEAVRFQALEDH